ncbi:MAG: hypothetical protein AAF153_01090, partial [Pseudomonadota bacterium]
VNYVKFNLSEKTSSGQKYTRIAPVDFRNTGTVQQNQRWGDGVHQYLEVANQIPLNSESPVSEFMSYYNYAKQFDGGIYGLSGTLGNDDTSKFFNDNYDVPTVIVPTHLHKNLFKMPAIITDNLNDWQENIIYLLQTKVEGNRAALVILKTMLQVNVLETVLKSLDFDGHIKTFGLNRPDEAVVFQKPLQAGDVVIATNLAGRGADPKISKTVADNGGLLVILGDLPTNQRVEDQAYGRAARGGAIGSAIMVFNKEETSLNCEDIDCYYQHRANNDSKTLSKLTKITLPNFAQDDHLFSEYVKLLRSIISPNGYDIVLKDATNQYASHNAKNIVLSIDKDSGSVIAEIDNTRQSTLNYLSSFIFSNQQINLTQYLNVIKPDAARHISLIFDKTSLSLINLNHLDFEAVHFVVTTAMSDLNKKTLSLDLDSKFFGDNQQIIPRIFKSYYLELQQYKPSDNIWNQSHKQVLSAFDSAEVSFLTEFAHNSNDCSHLNLNQDQPLIDEQLSNVKYIKLFNLWLADREQHNSDLKLKQFKDEWAMWLKNGRDLPKLTPKFKQDGSLDTYNLLRQQENINYLQGQQAAKFFAEQYQQTNDASYISNPYYFIQQAWHNRELHYSNQASGYLKINHGNQYGAKLFSSGSKYTQLTPLDSAMNATVSHLNQVGANVYQYFSDSFHNYRNPLEMSAKFLDLAKTKDHRLNWAVYNLEAIIDLDKISGKIRQSDDERINHAKQRYVDSIGNAIYGINNYIIPSLEALYYYSIAKHLVTPNSELAIMMKGSAELYRQIGMRYQENVNRVAASDYNQMIRVGKMVTFGEIAEMIDVKELYQLSQNEFDTAEPTANSTTAEYVIYDNPDNATSPIINPY